MPFLGNWSITNSEAGEKPGEALLREFSLVVRENREAIIRRVGETPSENIEKRILQCDSALRKLGIAAPASLTRHGASRGWRIVAPGAPHCPKGQRGKYHV